MAETKIISFSELDTYRQCPKKHEIGYKERWKSPTTGPALVRGTLWHNVMETWYRLLWDDQAGGVSRPDLAAHTEMTKRTWLGGDAGTQNENQQLVEWMFDGYLEMYPDDYWEWKVLAVEHAPTIWLPTATGGRSRFKLKLKIDLVVRWDGRIWIVDHKSGKDLPKEKQLDIDDQFGLYTWALQRMGKKVFGSCHNAARTYRHKEDRPLVERFHRTRLTRTDQELETIAIEAWRTAKAAYAWKPGEAPRAPDSDRCGWRCDFTEPCLLGRKGADEREVLKSMGFVQDFTRH